MVYIDSPWLYRPSHTHVCTHPHRYTHVHTCAHSVTCPVLLLMILPLLGTASPTWCSGKPLEDSASMASSPGTFPGSFRLFPGPLPCSEFPKQHSVLTPKTQIKCPSFPIIFLFYLPLFNWTPQPYLIGVKIPWLCDKC